MTTIAATATALRRGAGRVHRGMVLAGILLAWPLLWIPLHGRDTLALDAFALEPVHLRLNRLRDGINAHRAASPFFTGFVDAIRAGVDRLTIAIQALISQPAYGRPAPVVGWLGVVALSVLIAYALGSGRVALLTGAGLTTLGLLGYWRESMDTLALTLAAVLICLVVGIPLGVWVGLSRRAEHVVTPVLDLMQAMPTFVYLAPLTLFFLIGPASAVIATFIYAVPPAVRITAHAVRSVPASALEPSVSLGATRWQQLRTVRLPMARRTIVVGINQTTMCALSMVTIAALIDAPGLGQVVVHALEILDVGTAFRAGLAIVVLAIVLDRATSAAGHRIENRGHRTRARRWRHALLAGLAVPAAVAAYLSYTFVWASQFPGPDGGLVGGPVARGVTAATDWMQIHLAGATDAVKNAATYGLLNPLESLVAGSPWYLTCLVMLAAAGVLAGTRAVLVAALCLGLLLGTGVWHDAMVTLASTLLATALVIVLGLVVGVWLGRSERADRVVRPVLDAAQVMPAFVYLVPFIGLFKASRFTAIIAAVVFAAPVSVKLIVDGIRAVPGTVVEAAVSCGSTPWQVITKVQVPMAARSLMLAANQGLMYVLSMVVVGGLVGAGALGYLVVAGFSQSSLFGKGLAAGMAIVLLGVLLDRTTQEAARRAAARPGGPHAAWRGR